MAQSIKPQISVIEQQRIILKNKYGENLVGILHETGSQEVIILCHGFASSKESPINLNVAEALTKEGFSIFRFDFSGNGESEGTFEIGNYNKEADDLRSVVVYFSRMKRVVGGIIGHSKGGVVVLVYASKYRDVPMVINVSGRYKMDRGIEEHLGKDFMERIKEHGFIDVKNKQGNIWYRATEESLLERLATDMHALCLEISKDCSESEGTFEIGNYNKEADDLRYVVLYFSRMKRVVGGILGHSKGGVVVLVYASKYHDVPMVVNVSGRYKMDRGIEEHLGKDYMERIKENGFIDVKDKQGNIMYRATAESLLERLATDMHAICLSIAKECRVLTVHGSEDECIPVEDAFKFSKIIHDHKLHIVEGADHCYNNHQSQLVEVVVNFIRGTS